MADNDDEKPLEPSQRRLDQAREEGQILRSRDLSAAFATFSVLLTAVFIGPYIVQQCLTWVQDQFQQAALLAQSVTKDESILVSSMFELFGRALLLLAPLFIAGMVAAILGSVGFGGLAFSTKALEPKFSRLSPLKGIKRILSMHGLTELGKSVLKVLVLGSFVYLVLKRNATEMMELLFIPQPNTIASLGYLLRFEVLILGAGLFIIASADIPIQWLRHRKQLKMSHQEMKDEYKQTEGDPKLKAKIRQMQQERARGRMMQAIPTADVILTNPTHYAVALRYDEKTMQAPIVVAKGAGEVAQKIKELGKEHRVIMLESPKLTRALYKHADLEQEVPTALFKAVAQVLAHVYKLRQHIQGPLPEWEAVDIPDGWDPFDKNKIS